MRSRWDWRCCQGGCCCWMVEAVSTTVFATVSEWAASTTVFAAVSLLGCFLGPPWRRGAVLMRFSSALCVAGAGGAEMMEPIHDLLPLCYDGESDQPEGTYSRSSSPALSGQKAVTTQRIFRPSIPIVSRHYLSAVVAVCD